MQGRGRRAKSATHGGGCCGTLAAEINKKKKKKKKKTWKTREKKTKSLFKIDRVNPKIAKRPQVTVQHIGKIPNFTRLFPSFRSNLHRFTPSPLTKKGMSAVHDDDVATQNFRCFRASEART